MTDIVERLRNDYFILKQDYDALREVREKEGNEIERLREENKFLRSLVADKLRALEQKP